MADIEFHQGENAADPVTDEVEAELKIGQAGETFSISGYGMDEEDALKNAVTALNKFLTKAEIEAKTGAGCENLSAR